MVSTNRLVEKTTPASTQNTKRILLNVKSGFGNRWFVQKNMPSDGGGNGNHAYEHFCWSQVSYYANICPYVATLSLFGPSTTLSSAGTAGRLLDPVAACAWLCSLLYLFFQQLA